MSFLSGILASLLEWVLSKLATLGISWAKTQAKIGNDEAKTQQNTTTLNNATTEAERQSATQNIANKLGDN